MTVWIGKALRMERLLQALVALLLAEKFVNWKPDHPDAGEAVSWNRPGMYLQNARSRLSSSDLT